MLTAANLFVKYGDRVLLDEVTFSINDRDRVGLVGRNGAGKSTLLRLISATVSPDSGKVQRPSGSTLGFLKQEISFGGDRSVIEEALSAFADLKQMEERLETLNKEVAERTDYESDSYLSLIEELTSLSERHSLLGGQTQEADAEKVLGGLGFKSADLNRSTSTFSGGWQMRIELAKLLLQQPDYLLLDEPTNHLDIESILWLEQFLQTYPGAIIVISHDRQFLDNVTNRTLEVELGKIYDYKAAYSKYRVLRAERREKMQAAFENQQRVIAQRERTINRFMAKATKTKMAQSMKKQLDKMERIEMDHEDTAAMNLRFAEPPRSGEVVVEGKKVVKAYGENHVLQGVDLKLLRGQRMAFVGQNGQGKTTLARLLIKDLELTSGEIELGYNVSVGYYAQNQSDELDLKKTLLETMEDASPPEMRTKLRNILGAFLFSGEDVDKKVSVLSGGERARLALACMLLRPFNLLVLDEPTNHLDIISKEVLKGALMDYKGSLIVVSHDREFLTDLTDVTVEFKDHKLYHHLGDVNYFLKKRAVDNLREVEARAKTPAKAAVAASPAEPVREFSFEERKARQRALQNAEKRIARLESEIEKIEKQMADPSFYQSEGASDVMQKHQAKKQELDAAMEGWEKAQEAVDEMGD